MSTTPRSKVLSKSDGGTPRAKPAVKKAKKKITATPAVLEMKINDAQNMTGEETKADLSQMQQKYQQLVADFNEQQDDLKEAQKTVSQLEDAIAKTKAKNGSVPTDDKDLQILQLMEVRPQPLCMLALVCFRPHIHHAPTRQLRRRR